MTKFSLEEAERVWLISDTHFDHINIISYCKRPFRTVREMNEALWRNWNGAIANSDLVYFLGDMSHGRGARTPKWWATQLNGSIAWVKGSHDRNIQPTLGAADVIDVVQSTIVLCGGVEFLLVHDVFDAIRSWGGWVIHGHSHDSRPHLDRQRKRVNVSADVIDYKPVSLAQVVRRVSNGVGRGVLGSLGA